MTHTFLRRTKRTFASLLIFFCILSLAGFFAWWSLKQGINFRQLSFSTADIRNLSIRLDRGFIILVERIDIADSQAADKGEGLEAHIPSIKKWGHLIREIDIKRLHYRNHALTVTYRNGQFLLENDRFVLEAAVAHDEKIYHLELTGLLIKPYNLAVNGAASYDRSTDRFHFTGHFRNPWCSGSLLINEDHGQVEAHISTDAFDNLAGVLDQLPIDEDVISWVADNITAGQYRIKELRLRFPLKDWRDIGPDNISGTAVAGAAAVRFHPGLEPVLCDSIDISLHDDHLSFALTTPRYKNKNLAGSSVHIDHLTRAGTRLVVNIRTETGADEDVHAILDRYHISFPARQRTGMTKADLKLTFDLPEFALNARGLFIAGPGEWTWNDVPLHAEKIRVELDNKRITIRQADISYRDILRTRLSGLVDLVPKHAALQCDIDHLRLGTKNAELLRASGIRLPVAVDFSTDPVSVYLEELKTTIRLGGDEKNIAIDSLRAVAPLVPSLNKLHFSEGYVHLAIPDTLPLRFEGEIEVPDSPLVLDGRSVTSFRFQGAGTPEKIEASINEDHITVTVTDRITVRLREYLVTIDTDDFTNDAPALSYTLPLTVSGPKTLLNANGLLIPTGAFEFNTDGPDRKFGARLEQGQFLYESSGDTFNFTGKELDAEIARNFIKFADFTNGILNVTLSGKRNNYNGYIEFTEVLIKGYLVMNNILAFLNTIPALATLSSPGFDQDGYRVQEGFVHFDVTDKLLTIRQLRADGITVNCEATGWVDFNDRNLHLSLELFTMKDYSKIIGLVPLAGYAILGEDGSLSTSLDVTGSLDKPVIQTNLARDILLSPLHIIRRTVEWPFRQLEKLNGQSAEPPGPAD